MRYIYDQFDNYFGNAALPVKIIITLLRPYLQWWDRRSNKNVDVFIANSNFVKKRIVDFYEMKSEVIFPFVDLKDFKRDQNSPPRKKNYYLMVTAFAPNKRVDLAIEAFNSLGPDFKLVIIGTGSSSETTKLKSLAKSNIEFLGNVSREIVITYYSEAKAFIFPGIEDFGITPLESLASGTPVIAYRSGGVLDTLTEETADFFNTPTVDSLKDAILSFKPERFNPAVLQQRANDFSKEIFHRNMLSILSTAQ